jgi:hypothetical protein
MRQPPSPKEEEEKEEKEEEASLVVSMIFVTEIHRITLLTNKAFHHTS